MADEINERHYDGGEDRTGGEGRDEKCERGKETALRINHRDAREEVWVERGGANEAQGFGTLFRWRPAHLPRGLAEDALFAQREDKKEKRAHRDETEGEQQQDPEQFAGQILEARDWLGEDGVSGAVLNFLRQKPRGGEDGKERSKKAHRAERDVFQDLEFLLERHLRHENGAPNQEQREQE